LRLISRNDAFGVKVDNNQKTLIPLGVLNLTEREVRPDKSQMLFDLSTMLRRTQAGSSHPCISDEPLKTTPPGHPHNAILMYYVL
jgi:hypothetical protein